MHSAEKARDTTLDDEKDDSSHIIACCNTVKPFNLAALIVGDFAFKIILAPFYLYLRGGSR